MKQFFKWEKQEKPPKQHWCEYYDQASCPNSCAKFEEYPNCPKTTC